MKNNNDLKTDIAIISTKLDNVQVDVKEIKEKLESDYVTKEEFDPYKRIIQGIITLILTAIVGALLTLILK